MTMITTILGFSLEKVSDPIGGISLPGTWEERFRTIARTVGNQDYAGRVYDGTNPQGLRVFLIGESNWSRALAVHPEDAPGVVYMLVDDGTEIDMTQPVRAAKAMWLGDLIATGYTSVQRALDPAAHQNARLKGGSVIK